MERESNFSKILKIFEYLMVVVYIAFSVSLFLIPSFLPVLSGGRRSVVEIGVVIYAIFRAYIIYKKQKND